ncbi:MAG: leucyl/phenylalanyl-tRNA--protein transferase [Planctomycetota bacterium]
MHGASLDPEVMLSAYAQGAFPMTDPDGVTRWYTADPRGVIPLDNRFRVSRSLRQTIRRGHFRVDVNRNFEAVMRACMLDRPDGTWISEELVGAYVHLHSEGFAHSVETYTADGDELVGGLYGVSLGGAFFGESMFHRRSDASKVALVSLVERLRARQFVLLDAQARTRHLSHFGCQELDAPVYLRWLRDAIMLRRTFK